MSVGTGSKCMVLHAISRSSSAYQFSFRIDSSLPYSNTIEVLSFLTMLFVDRLTELYKRDECYIFSMSPLFGLSLLQLN